MLHENFLTEYWRKKPFFAPAFLNDAFLKTFKIESFFDWSSASKETVRLFTIDTNTLEKTGKSFIIDNKNDIIPIYNSLKEKNESFTFHMNGVEKVEKNVDKIRNLLDIPYVLRFDDIIATLSTENSGIGYHSGHEDGFIVQLQGKRNWKVWSSEFTTLEYKEALLNPKTQAPFLKRPEDNSGLLIDVITKPGDILYIPPFCPHEGITLEESLSLSIAWRGLAPSTFLQYLDTESNFKVDLNKSTTLFEDHLDIKNISKQWLSDTINSIPHNNQSENTNEQLEKIIHSFIQLQIDKYFEYERNV